jgi:hypothetical protein
MNAKKTPKSLIERMKKVLFSAEGALGVQAEVLWCGCRSLRTAGRRASTPALRMSNAQTPALRFDKVESRQDFILRLDEIPAVRMNILRTARRWCRLLC